MATTPTITNTWNIVAMDCVPTVGSLTDYVTVAHWTLTGTDTATPPNTGSVYGTVSFEVNPTKPDYTPYAQLTLAEVVGWVQASLGAEQVAAYEANVATQIENQINPPIVQPPLPWVTPPTTTSTSSTPSA